MHFNHNKAIEFWRWFQSIEKQLSENLTNPHLIKKLDSLVSSIGKFEWELGPLDDAIRYLAISPILSKELLTATREIIKLAPICIGWQFLPAKPAKKGQLVFEMTNQYGTQITVDASKWEYVLYQYEDYTFGIDITIGDIDCSLDIAYLAADIALTNILGEEEYMEAISDVKIVKTFEQTGKASMFEHLGEHLLSLK